MCPPSRTPYAPSIIQPERQRRGFAPRHRGFQLSASRTWEGIGLGVYLSRVDLRAGEGVVVGTHLDLFPPTLLLGVDGCRLLASLSLASRDFRLPTVDLGQMFSLMKLCTSQLAPRASRVQFNARVGTENVLARGTPKRDRKYIQVTFFYTWFVVE